jgi:hypothetical protein
MFDNTIDLKGMFTAHESTDINHWTTVTLVSREVTPTATARMESLSIFVHPSTLPWLMSVSIDRITGKMCSYEVRRILGWRLSWDALQMIGTSVFMHSRCREKCAQTSWLMLYQGYIGIISQLHPASSFRISDSVVCATWQIEWILWHILKQIWRNILRIIKLLKAKYGQKVHFAKSCNIFIVLIIIIN